MRARARACVVAHGGRASSFQQGNFVFSVAVQHPGHACRRIEQLRARSDHLSEATHPSEMEEASLVKQ